MYSKTPAIPNLVVMGPNHQVTFVIFTGIILNFASRQVIISLILGIAAKTQKYSYTVYRNCLF